MVGKPTNINDLCQMDPLPFLSMAKNIFIMKRINNPVAGPEFLKGGFSFSLTKTPAQFELKTKKKKGHQPSYFSLGSILHLLLDDF